MSHQLYSNSRGFLLPLRDWRLNCSKRSSRKQSHFLSFELELRLHYQRLQCSQKRPLLKNLPSLIWFQVSCGCSFVFPFFCFKNQIVCGIGVQCTISQTLHLFHSLDDFQPLVIIIIFRGWICLRSAFRILHRSYRACGGARPEENFLEHQLFQFRSSVKQFFFHCH